MATLAATITATQTTITLSGDVSAAVPGRLYAIGTEIVRLIDFGIHPNVVGGTLGGDTDRTVWRIQRAQEGSTAASHNSGVEVIATLDAFALGTALTAPAPTEAPTLAEVLAAGNELTASSTIRASGTGDATAAVVTFAPAYETGDPAVLNAGYVQATGGNINDDAGDFNGGFFQTSPAVSEAAGAFLAGGGNASASNDLGFGGTVTANGSYVYDGHLLGGSAQISGGIGENNSAAAYVTADGGGSEGVDVAGRVAIMTGGTSGSAAHLLTADGTGYADWAALVTTAAASPVGGGLSSVLVADTTNKKLYAWTGSAYVQIGDWS